MLVLILCSLLLAIIALVFTSMFYLISLIGEETDDSTIDALVIDSDQFSSGPLCPVDPQQQHTRECIEANSNRSTFERRLSLNNLMERTADLQTSPSEKRLSASSQTGNGTIDETWTTSIANQKNIIASRLGPLASKQVFDDFDPEEMHLGGNGLHWCKSRKSLDRLIKLGVPLDALNNHRETSLHVAIRKRRLQIVIGLLCHGADLEKVNRAGETPLLCATKVNDIFSCQLLLVFDAEVNVEDENGLSPRHYAAAICDKHKANQQQQSQQSQAQSQQQQQQQPNAAHLILAMLNEMGAKRCVDRPAQGPKDETNSRSRVGALSSCTDGCSALGTYNGNSFNRWPNFSKESLYKRHMFTDLIEQQRQRSHHDHHSASSGAQMTKRSRLLCIDGGGLRGVIVCQILIELQRYLERPLMSYFDWIGGTSVGAFLSCALGTGTSIHQLRRICFDVKDEVFTGTKPYNSKFLERVLKRTYGTARLSDIKGKKLAVTTVLADRDPCQLRFFRNYKSPVELLERYGYSAEEFNSMSAHSVVVRRASTTPTNTTTTAATSANKSDKNKVEPKTDVIDENERDPFIWQAVRASAAAPFFFKPYGPFMDGGIISNNPTMDMLTEFFSFESVKKFLKVRLARMVNVHAPEHDPDLREPPSKMDLVVSLGTGRGRVIGRQSVIDFGHVASGFSTVFSPIELVRSIRGARDLFKKLMQQSCHTDDHILDRAQSWCYSLGVPYFRINPPLATIFSIDDKRDEQLIFALWQTKLYMMSMSGQLRELGDILDGRRLLAGGVRYLL